MEARLIKILEEMQEKLNGREAILGLCSNECTEYDRGRHMGKIEMIGYIMQELAGKDESRDK